MCCNNIAMDEIGTVEQNRFSSISAYKQSIAETLYSMLCPHTKLILIKHDLYSPCWHVCCGTIQAASIAARQREIVKPMKHPCRKSQHYRKTAYREDKGPRVLITRRSVSPAAIAHRLRFVDCNPQLGGYT